MMCVTWFDFVSSIRMVRFIMCWPGLMELAQERRAHQLSKVAEKNAFLVDMLSTGLFNFHFSLESHLFSFPLRHTHFPPSLSSFLFSISKEYSPT